MKRALVLTGLGVSGGQAVVLLATPLLARIYDPTQFGVYASVLAMAGVLAAIASLRFDAAIPAISDADVRPIFRVALLLPVLVCPLVLLSVEVMAKLSDELATYMDSLPLLPILAIATVQGVVTVLLAFSTRSGWFARYALLRLAQPLVFVLVAIMGILSLEVSVALGWLVALVLGLVVCRDLLGGSLRESLLAIRRCWKYPVMSVPLMLLDSLALALPIMFIASNYGNSEAGSYSQVQRLVGAPLILVGMAVAQVFFKYAGDHYRRNLPVLPLMWRFVFGMGGLGIILLIVVLAVGSGVMAFLLGPGWRIDTVFMLLALFPVIARSLASPVSSIFLITDRIGRLGCWQVAYFLVTLCVLIIGSASLTFDNFLLALAVSECLMYSIYLYLAVSLGRQCNPGAQACVAS